MMTTDDDTALHRLATYRLVHDLTFDELSERMNRAGFPVRSRALHFVLTNRLRRGPRDRTLYKIEQFVRRVVDPEQATAPVESR